MFVIAETSNTALIGNLFSVYVMILCDIKSTGLEGSYVSMVTAISLPMHHTFRGVFVRPRKGDLRAGTRDGEPHGRQMSSPKLFHPLGDPY